MKEVDEVLVTLCGGRFKVMGFIDEDERVCCCGGELIQASHLVGDEGTRE